MISAKILNEATATIGFISWRSTKRIMIPVVTHKKRVRLDSASRNASGQGSLHMKSTTEIQNKKEERKLQQLLFAHPTQRQDIKRENIHIQQVQESVCDYNSEIKHDKQSQHNHYQFPCEDNERARDKQNDQIIHEYHNSVSHQLRVQNTTHSKKREP